MASRQRPDPLTPDLWRGLQAPSLADIEVLAAQSFARLPQAFRDMAQDVLIRVEDFPSQDVMQEMDAGEFDLLGLFQGMGLAHAGAVPDSLQMPNTIFLYRRAILDYWAEHHESLGAIVTHVLVHEIGHHFGLSDEDMDAITGPSP
jgi:predicted Zn-dependent protease with MMP-like domain